MLSKTGNKDLLWQRVVSVVFKGKRGDGTENGNKGITDAVEFGNSQLMAKGERQRIIYDAF